MEYGSNLLLASGIRLETALPGAESVLDTSVIGNVFGKRLGSIEMYIRAIRAFDCVVSVLLVDALCFFGECLFGLWRPPLKRRKEKKKDGQVVSKKASSIEKQSKKDGRGQELTLVKLPVKSNFLPLLSKPCYFFC